MYLKATKVVILHLNGDAFSVSIIYIHLLKIYNWIDIQ